jgi:hypothetical protein
VAAFARRVARGFGMETAMDIAALRAGLRLVEVELDLAGFAHRARQLTDIASLYLGTRSNLPARPG